MSSLSDELHYFRDSEHSIKINICSDLWLKCEIGKNLHRNITTGEKNTRFNPPPPPPPPNMIQGRVQLKYLWWTFFFVVINIDIIQLWIVISSEKTTQAPESISRKIHFNRTVFLLFLTVKEHTLLIVNVKKKKSRSFQVHCRWKKMKENK